MLVAGRRDNFSLASSTESGTQSDVGQYLTDARSWRKPPLVSLPLYPTKEAHRYGLPAEYGPLYTYSHNVTVHQQLLTFCDVTAYICVENSRLFLHIL